MNDVKAYIESGTLELYALGQLNAQECAAVEAMAASHPEIQAELFAIETTLESYADEHAIAPPADTEQKVLAQFPEPALRSGQPQILPRGANVKDIRLRVTRYALAACIALLLFCGASLYSLRKQLRTAHDQMALLTDGKQELAAQLSRLRFEKAGLENRVAMTTSREWRTIQLAGPPEKPGQGMLVYWHKQHKGIVINYSAMQLPETDKAHVYQLWALADGKPVSLGTFGPAASEHKAVKKMGPAMQAEAFAVTIEPIGGSQKPTMQRMVAMGRI